MKDERKIIKELKAGNIYIDRIKVNGASIHLFADVFYHRDIKEIETIITKYALIWYIALGGGYISIHR